jgi:hypothetical protein
MNMCKFRISYLKRNIDAHRLDFPQGDVVELSLFLQLFECVQLYLAGLKPWDSDSHEIGLQSSICIAL